MKKKRIFNLLISFLLIFSIAIIPCPALAEDEELTEEDVAWENADNDIYGGGIDDAKEEEPEFDFVEGTSSSTLVDIEDQNLKNKVDFLVKLGFMSVYDDGTFKPDEKITRADFLRAVFKAINQDVNSYYKTDYKFNDIDVTNENYALMSVAVERGYIGLYNDGTVRPDGEISVLDCTTILLKIMGYSAYVGVNGGYSTGYIATAYKLGFFKKVKESTKGATRIEAAQLIFTALNTEMLRQIQSGDFHKYYTDKRVTLLSVFHDIYFENGLLTATSITSIGDNSRQKKGNVLINGILYSLENREYNDFIGYNVDFWYVMDDEVSEKRIVYMLPDSKVTEIVIDAEDIIGFSNGKLQYMENNKKRTVKIEAGCDLIYNGKLKGSYNSSIYNIKNGYIKIVSVDGVKNGLVFINSYFNVPFDSITSNGSIVSILMKYGVKPIEIDVSNENIVIDMYNSVGRMDVTISQQSYYDANSILKYKTVLPSIPANSVLSIFADKTTEINGDLCVADGAEYIKIIISDTAIDGSVDSVSGDYVTINGKEYLISSSNYLYDSTPKFGLDATGKFIFDYSGNLSLWIPDTSAMDYKYGYLINAGKENNLSENLKLRILTASNDITVFKSSSKMKINDVKPKNAADALKKLGESAKFLDKNFTISQLVKYTLNSNNEITKLQTVTASTGIAEGYEEDHLSRAVSRTVYNCRKDYGYALVDQVEKTTTFAGPSDIYFTVPEAETFNDEDYAVTTGWDQEKKTVDVFDVSDTLCPKAIVVYAPQADQLFKNPFLLVTKVTEKINEDGDYVARVYGYSGSTAREYDMVLSLKDKVKYGDIITVSGDIDSLVKSVEYIGNIFEILKNDKPDDPTITPVVPKTVSTYSFKIFEAYDYDITTRALVLQRGKLLGNTNKREFQRISYWFPKASSFFYGACLCEVDKDNNLTLTSGSYSHIKGAADYGAEGASKIVLGEQSYGVRFMIIINKVY